jgi:hypothetical protein
VSGSSSYKILDLGFTRGLLRVYPPSGSSSNSSQVQLQHLHVKGLAQGLGAAAATNWTSPDVWTILGWAFERWGSSASLQLVALLLLRLHAFFWQTRLHVTHPNPPMRLPV